MNLECSVAGIGHLKSRSQQVRVMTESWFGRSAYCISCSSEYLKATRPNTIAHDFLCEICGQCYELKSSGSPEKNRIVDGAYATMIARIRENKAPSLMLLQYDRGLVDNAQSWKVQRLVAVHPIFLTEVVIEARNPLSITAKRAGWRGCNIRLDRVPSDGRIEIVKDSKVVDRSVVRRKFAAAQRLAAVRVHDRGWTGIVLGIVRRLRTPTFNLAEVYAQKRTAEEAFPKNNNLEAKLRQQLQILRDLGYVEFLGRGKYKVLSDHT